MSAPVPAGLVLHDPTTLADPVLFELVTVGQRRGIGTGGGGARYQRGVASSP